MTEDKADRIDFWALTGCSALMLLMLVPTWYSASLGGSSVTASGFSSASILAIVVILLAGVVGALAISFLRVAEVPWIFASKRDLAHLAIVVGLFLGAWYVYRAANPPRFYQVAD
ncbi:MAG: hypothetical protein ACLP50_05330, partial [Solirubrobacteraceae bacterium]